MDAQRDRLALHDGAHAVQHGDIDKPDAADLHQVADDVWRAPDEHAVRNFADFNDIVGDHAVPAL